MTQHVVARVKHLAAHIYTCISQHILPTGKVDIPDKTPLLYYTFAVKLFYRYQISSIHCTTFITIDEREIAAVG